MLRYVPLPRVFCRLRPGFAGPAEGTVRSRGSSRGDRCFPWAAAPTPGPVAPRGAAVSAPTCSELDPRARGEVQGQFLRRGTQTRAWLPAPRRWVQRTGRGAAPPAGGGGARNGWAESGEIRSRGSQGTPAIPSPAALLIFPSWFPHPTFSGPLAAPRPGSQGKVSLKTDATKKLLQTRTF